MSQVSGRPTNRLSFAWLGLIGFVLIGIVTYFAFAKRVPLVHGYRAEAVFSNSSQLRKGSPVRIAGVDVGKVVGLADGPGTTAIVKMEFKDAALPIHQDATLRIRPRLFLEGGFYIELRPGSPSAPKLNADGTIPLGQTSVPVQFDQVLTSLDHPTRESIRRTVTNLADALDNGAAKAIGDSAKPFIPAFRNTAIVAQAARGVESHDLSRMVAGLSSITGTLAANDQQLGDLVTSLARTSGALAAEQGNVRASISSLDQLMQSAPPSLRAIDRSLPSLQRFAVALRPSLPQTPATLRHVDALLAQAEPLVRPAELPALLTKLTPTVKRLPTLSKRLTTLFPLVTPVTDCVRDRATPVLKAKLNDGKLSTGRPVWQDLAHAGVGLNSASQDFDGNGPAVRYLAAVGDQSIATGSVPGIGTLVGKGSTLEGSTPQWLGTGKNTAFHPEATCRDQPAPDLQARTPYPATGSAAKRSAGHDSAAAAERTTTTTTAVSSTGAAPSALRQSLRRIARAVSHLGAEGAGR